MCMSYNKTLDARMWPPNAMILKTDFCETSTEEFAMRFYEGRNRLSMRSISRGRTRRVVVNP